MICTYCKRIFHPDDGDIDHKDVSSFWNTPKGTAHTCSAVCFTKVKQDHNNYMKWKS